MSGGTGALCCRQVSVRDCINGVGSASIRADAMITSYHQPRDLDSALSLLDEHRTGALVLAGGTTVANRLRSGGAWAHLIDIAGIADLRGISGPSAGRLQIGALTTCTELAISPIIAAYAPILSQAALSVGSPQIRNLATLGGNVWGRCPDADLIPALLVLDATVTLKSRSGTRQISFYEYLDTGLPRSDELLVAVDFGSAPRGTAFLRFSARRAIAPAVASVAVYLRADAESRLWNHVRIALGGVAPRVIRALKAETQLSAMSGAAFADAVRLAGDAAMTEAAPTSDAWASERYRRHIVGVLTRRALIEAGQQVIAG